MVRISTAEWFDAVLKAQRDAGVRQPGEFSAAELAEQCGKSTSTVASQLRRAVKAGRVEFAGRRRDEGIDGRVVWIPVYRRRGEEVQGTRYKVQGGRDEERDE